MNVSWTIEKAECQRIDAFELRCWRRLLRVPWTPRRSTQSILKETSPGCSLEGLMLRLKLQYFSHLMRRVDIGKDPDAGRDWGREENGTRGDEMAGWHHRLDAHEFEWTPGVGDGQGGLVCCDSWGRKESDTTEWLNWTLGYHWKQSVEFCGIEMKLPCSHNANKGLVFDFHKSIRTYSLGLFFRTTDTNDLEVGCFPSAWPPPPYLKFSLAFRFFTSASSQHWAHSSLGVQIIPYFWSQLRQTQTAWCGVAVFYKTPIGPMWGGKKHRRSSVDWKPARQQAQCSAAGMELPSAFWMTGDTVEILWNYLFIGSWAFCRKWLFWKEEKRIPEFSLYLRHAPDSCALSL